MKMNHPLLSKAALLPTSRGGNLASICTAMLLIGTALEAGANTADFNGDGQADFLFHNRGSLPPVPEPTD